jgi:HSP20 family protein
LRDELDRFFETPFNGIEERQHFLTGWGPALDVYEDKDNVTVKVEIPGMKKEEIEISLHEGTLTLSGERKNEAKGNYGDAQAIRTERFAGRFSRSITLPADVNAEAVKATYKDGLLTVVLPKAEESKPKQIEIKG